MGVIMSDKKKHKTCVECHDLLDHIDHRVPFLLDESDRPGYWITGLLGNLSAFHAKREAFGDDIVDKVTEKLKERYGDDISDILEKFRERYGDDISWPAIHIDLY